MSLDSQVGDIPPDESPAPEPTVTVTTNNSDAEYLGGSSDSAPYGYFPDADGKPDYSRPRKRRPRGTGGSRVSVTPRSGTSDTQARQAAALLATMNRITAASLQSFGLPMTGTAISTANDQFETQAYEALKLDPALAKKILSAGGNSGKTALVMAYSMLAMAIMPVGYMEIKEKRKGADNGDDALS